MKKVFSFMYKCHKWFGLPLALMFLMWYCSGIVMMYHSFPRISPSEIPVEKTDSAILSTLWFNLPDTLRSCRITHSARHMLIHANGETYGAFSPTRMDLDRIAASFGTKIEKIDTLHDVDKCTPFKQLTTRLSFYRIIGDDSSYIYVSSKTGEIVQQCTLSERRWAWVGALPHYVYITPIRRDAKLWRTIVIWMSGLSTVSVIFGIIIAIRFLLKKHKWHLFKKRSWQWHYSWGLVFGLFMLAFIFSGMMSLAQIPDWIMKSKELANSPVMSVAKSRIDLSTIPQSFGSASLMTDPQLMWSVTSGKKTSTIAASASPIDFSPAFMTPIIEHQTGEKVISVRKIEEDFFYHRGGIPGWRARTDHFSVYWNEKGYFRILDRKAKAHYVCYRFLHTMKIPGLYQIKWLHSIYMWVILLGGLMIVGTGTWLSLKALKNL